MTKKKSSRKASFQKKKSGLGKLWKTAKKEVEDSPDMFGTVTPGPYLAKLVSAKVTEIGASNWKNFAMSFEIQEGDFEETIVTKRAGLETEENLTFLVRDLQKLEVDTDDLELNSEEDLDALGKQLVGMGLICRIRVSEENDAGFQSVRVQKVMEAAEEEPEDDTEETDPTFEVGDKVQTTVDDEVYQGEITKLKKSSAMVLFEDGDKEDVDFDDLEKVEDKGDESDPDDLVGTTRGFKKGKKMLVGKILSVDAEEGTFKMKTDTGKKVTGDIDDLEESEDEAEEEPEDDTEDDEGLSVGDDVIVEYKGKDTIGKLKAIDEDENEGVILLKKTKKKITVSLDEIYVADE